MEKYKLEWKCEVFTSIYSWFVVTELQCTVVQGINTDMNVIQIQIEIQMWGVIGHLKFISLLLIYFHRFCLVVYILLLVY